MPRVNRRGPQRRMPDDITDAERKWAEGEPLRNREDRAVINYFTSGERLRHVWHRVHGEPIEEHIRATTDDARDIACRVFVNGAPVGRLTPPAARALVAGLPVDWS